MPLNSLVHLAFFVAFLQALEEVFCFRLFLSILIMFLQNIIIIFKKIIHI